VVLNELVEDAVEDELELVEVELELVDVVVVE